MTRLGWTPRAWSVGREGDGAEVSVPVDRLAGLEGQRLPVVLQVHWLKRSFRPPR